MSTDGLMKTQSLLLSPEKSFHLSVYAEQMASAFAEFKCSKPKRCNDIYTLNILDYIGGRASDGRKTLESSTKGFAS